MTDCGDDPLPIDASVPEAIDVRDDAAGPCCSICGKALRGTDWACLPCKREHRLTKSLATWPEWAKFLKLEEFNRRYGLYDSLESKTPAIPFDDEEELDN